ncbi:MAG: PQQ-binding-like beta-propeller repeat protein [Candidatus Latescibacteria bacterium]|nr:PQQ-binding-like beta-propeller repeat protein [Candidatus Latescibacterota bacterium]
MVWSHRIGGTGALEDRAWDVVVDAASDPIVTGVVLNGDGTADFLTFKLDGADGDEIWTRSLPGAETNLDARTQWLALCDDGDVVLGTKIWSSGTSYDVVLHRFDAADGGMVFHVEHGAEGPVADNPRWMTRDEAGDLLVAGVRDGDFMVLKVAGTDGRLLWDSVYDGPPGWYDAANTVIEGPFGTVVAGGFRTGAETSWDAAIVGFDPDDGSILWDRAFDAGSAQADEIAVLTGGGEDLYAVGYGYSPSTDSDLLSLRYRLEGAAAVTESRQRAPGAALSIGPNPMRGETRIALAETVRGPVRLSVFDVDGRRVLSRTPIRPTGGARSIRWDGRDGDGRALPPGAYFVRIQHREGIETGKIVLVD